MLDHDTVTETVANPALRAAYDAGYRDGSQHALELFAHKRLEAINDGEARLRAANEQTESRVEELGRHLSRLERDLREAHAEGLHTVPRKSCPDCRS